MQQFFILYLLLQLEVRTIRVQNSPPDRCLFDILFIPPDLHAFASVAAILTNSFQTIHLSPGLKYDVLKYFEQKKDIMFYFYFHLKIQYHFRIIWGKWLQGVFVSLDIYVQIYIYTLYIYIMDI